MIPDSVIGIGGAVIIVILSMVLLLIGIIGGIISCYKNFMKGYNR